MSDSLRVIFVAPIKIYNAEAEYVHRLAKGLIARGHKPVVMGIPGSPILERVAKDGIETCDSFHLTGLNPALLFRQIRGLSAYIEQGGFHIVNVHRSEGFIIVARAVHMLKPRPGLIRTRGDMRPVRRDPLNRKLYGQWSDRVIASNKLLEQELIIRLGLEPERVQTIYTGIDQNELKPEAAPEQVRKELGLEPDERVIACMGRIGMVKGHKYLLEAAPKILAEFPNTRFLLIYPYIEDDSPFSLQLSRSRWKDKFIMVGPRERRADVMQIAELAVIPSVRSEANCRAALEWMAMKKPIVGTRVGAVPEVIEQAETGFLIHPRQAQALADTLLNMLKHPDRCRRMGEKGNERLKRFFTGEDMLDKTIACYQEVLNELARS